MIEQQAAALPFRVHYTNAGASATGLTVTVDVYDETGTKIVTAASATEIAGGLYSYSLASGSNDAAGLYTAIFTTAGTVDQADMAAQWHVGVAGVENLDAATSTRLATAGYTVPPTAAANSDAVWLEQIADHIGTGGSTAAYLGGLNTQIGVLGTNQGTIAGLVSASAIAAAIWDAATTDHVIVGSTGEAIAAASSADVLANTIGSYASGTAGNALQRLTNGVIEAIQQYANSRLEIVKGEDYTGGGEITMTLDIVDGFTLSTGTVDLTLNGVVTGSAAAVQTGSSAAITITINRAVSDLYTIGVHKGALIFTDANADIHTLARFTVQVLGNSLV